MVVLRAHASRSFSIPGQPTLRGLLACIVLCTAAISAYAQAEKIVTALVPLQMQTSDASQDRDGYLAVSAPGSSLHSQASSDLLFDLGALPAGLKNEQVTGMRLLLVPKEGAERGMAIHVALAEQRLVGGKPSLVAVTPRYRLVSPPLPKDPKSHAQRSDTVNLPPGWVARLRSSPALRLQLLPQGNASRRIYYGRNTKDAVDDIEHPERLPRLIVAYSSAASRDDRQFSEPSLLTLSQTDGRKASSALAATSLPSGDFNGGGTEGFFDLQEVATASLTVQPVVYRGGLYLVRREAAATYLKQFSSATGKYSGAQLLLPHDIRPGSLMVVDDFGRLRILTNDAILSTTVDPAKGSFTPLIKRDFAFNQVPRLALPGPDGTLYVVQNSIYAINPDIWNRTGEGKDVPVKLWDIGIEDPDSARMTLNPDGTFLYVLARFAGKKSRLVAVNAQTGRDVPLEGGLVNTSGKLVTWVSGMNFETLSVGHSIPIGSVSCTVAALRPDRTGLTCMEDLGKQVRVKWAAFPDDLISFRNPVVTKTPKGDWVHVTGSSGSLAYLWGVRNDPVPRAGSELARFVGLWNYRSNGFSPAIAAAGQQSYYTTSDIGQPVLDTRLPAKGERQAQKELYFLEKGAVNNPGSQLTVVNAWTGQYLRAYSTIGVRVTGNGGLNVVEVGLENKPVIDGDGKILFWSEDELFMVDTKRSSPGWNSRLLKLPAPPQLFFGANGSLFGAAAADVHLLSPKPAR